MKLGDVVTWGAGHFGIKQKLTAKITAFDRPNHFQDAQVRGIFRNFTHDHFFSEKDGGTLMKDIFDFQCPLGIVGKIAEPIVFNHLKKFLITRNNVVKNIAEGDQWESLLTKD